MAIKCFISGVEYRITDKYSIREQAGQPSTSQLDVLADNKPIPKSHQKVELTEDNVRFFMGYILSVDAPTYSTAYETDIYTIQVASPEIVLTRRLIANAWRDKYTHEIVQDIYNEYLTEEGFALGTISTFDRQYSAYVSPRLKLSDILQELGDEVGAVAKIDENGTFSFVTRGWFSVVTPPAKITKLKKSETGQTVRTVQIVSGAKAETSLISRTVTWQADQAEFLAGYQIAAEPAITINGASVNVGVMGVNEGDSNISFLWKYGNNVILVNQGGNITPQAGDTVAFLFRGFYNIEVYAENETLKAEIASLSGTSGKIETMVVDTSITTQTDGHTTADGLLRENSEREETITLECHDLQATKILSEWQLNYPDIGVNGKYIVVERTITDMYDKQRVQVRLKNRGFYARYGTVYNKFQKQINNLSIRADDLVIKTTGIFETTNNQETWHADQSTLLYYPGDGTDLVAPVALELGGFYPGWGNV